MRGIVVGLLLLTVTATRADDQPRALETFAILGLEDVRLHAGAEVDTGNVGANRGTVRLGRHAAVSGTVLGDTIELAGNNRVGSLFCHFVQGPLRFGCATLGDPVVDVSRLSFVQVLPGSGEVHVPARTTTAPLPAGAYGRVTVATRGRLLFAGGTYDLLGLDVRHHAQLLCVGRCRIRVRERATLRSRGVIAVAAPLDGSALRIDVESQGPRPAFVSGAHATLAGTVYAPGGDVVLGAHGRYDGAFVGRTVTVGSGARVKLLSAF